MKNWRTSLGGLISVLGVALPHFGIPKEVGDAVVIIGTFIFSYFAKDHTNTGIGV